MVGRWHPTVESTSHHDDLFLTPPLRRKQFSIYCLLLCFFLNQCLIHLLPRYPADVKAFTHSGMKGEWDREQAGQRMKLKQPETWERLVSREGNKAATWEKLIGA